MRRAIGLVLLFAFAACAHTRQQTVSGWVSDAHCTVAHVGGKGADCVRKCIKGGAHIGHPEWTPQAMVLVVDGTESVLVVNNPETLTGHEATHVTVKGRVDGDRIQVSELLAD